MTAIYVDSREQKPLFDGDGVFVRALSVGDYTTPSLLGFAHAERKSPQDFYGSLVQGHVRFRNELLRAKEQGVKLVVFVECSESKFFGRRWPGAWFRRMGSGKLRKMISTMKDKYGLTICWCDGRGGAASEVVKWFGKMEALHG